MPIKDKHAFETIFENIINDVLNDSFTSGIMKRIDGQPLQLFASFDSEDPASIEKVINL